MKNIDRIIYLIINWLLITSIIDVILMGFPIPKFSIRNYPLRYIITKKNRIDIQNNFECAGYSAAYIMRHFDTEVTGQNMYSIMPNKMYSGYVYPKGIIKLMMHRRFKAYYRSGNISELKRQISKGIPVIAFIKVYQNKNYLHYVPVVGYDEENFYLAESLGYLVNEDNIYYNRKIPIKEFKRLWRTNSLRMPLYQYTYIVISKNS